MNEQQMPGSIVTLKNVTDADKQVWLDLTPDEIRTCLFSAESTGRQFLECKRFIGFRFYGYLVRIEDIVAVEEYR
jgi:hypothetical protein